jgi:geranylgeranyl pyrophosphate synthase
MPLPARPGSPRRNGTGGPSTRMAEDQLTPFLAECRGRVEGVLRSCLAPADTEPKRLHEAMRYAVLGDGKRLRPTLAYAAASATGVPWERLDAPAAALELIHAYSLVHDDMPALDDDDLRRGHPTCHVAFDQATALLAGDALQALAFDVLAQDRHSNAAARIAMVGELARASGSLGMAGGQALDLASEGQELDIAALENVHIHKTGALIRASVRMSAFANESLDQQCSEALDRYAASIGLAFQVQDDLLDVEGETSVIGKTRGADAAHDKATYPSLLGLDEAHVTATRLVDDAMQALSAFDERADPLRWIAEYIIHRDH